jgi:hypothetical protein
MTAAVKSADIEYIQQRALTDPGIFTDLVAPIAEKLLTCLHWVLFLVVVATLIIFSRYMKGKRPVHIAFKPVGGALQLNQSTFNDYDDLQPKSRTGQTFVYLVVENYWVQLIVVQHEVIMRILP